MAKIMCECCGEKEAKFKDYRETKFAYPKYFVCKVCLNRNNRSFFAKMASKKRKKIGGVVKKKNG
ncbi:hypothetical protein ES705_26167 [subsurface metagenome]